MIRISPAFLLLLALAVTAAAQPTSDDILVDATFVPCSDSVESLLILRDGRAVYALGKRGAMFTITGALLIDLQNVVDSTSSHVDTKKLDSCSTLGVILDGPKFILINTDKPAPQSRELHGRLERIRRLGQRKMDGTIERFGDDIGLQSDSNLLSEASIEPNEVRRRVRLSPIAREWRCSGTVNVAALVSHQGKVRQAFVQQVGVRGKCASLLVTTALRAVLLSSFEPATNKEGKAMGSWMEIEVPFSRPPKP
jgi:hypothetical protein